MAVHPVRIEMVFNSITRFLGERSAATSWSHHPLISTCTVPGSELIMDRSAQENCVRDPSIIISIPRTVLWCIEFVE